MSTTVGRRTLTIAFLVVVVLPLVALAFWIIRQDRPIERMDVAYFLVAVVQQLVLFGIVVGIVWFIRRTIASRRDGDRLARMDARLARMETKLDQGTAGPEKRR